jgi:hypothetical protein
LDGYIKLYRKSIENGWLKNGDLWRFWCYCLLKASYKNHSQILGFKQVDLQPGEFIFGRRTAAKEIKMSEQSIRTCLKNLEKMGNLTIKSTHLYSIISINNWHTYQEEDFATNPLTNPRLTQCQPSANHKQESNKEKNNTYSEEFLNFYKEYPRRVDKSGAWKAWEKCNGNRPGIDSLLEILSRHKKTDQWNRDGGKFIPHPATWINKRRWEDEVEVEQAGPFG